MYWRVYAMCCVRGKGRRIIEEYNPDSCIDELVNMIADTYDWDSVDDDDDAVNAVYDSISSEMYRRLKENGQLDCGDYMLVASDEKPEITIPNIIGYENL